MNDLSASLASLSRSYGITMQWIPSHCGVLGNETADSLAKKGATQDQTDRSTTYSETKTIIKANPCFNSTDPYYLLSRCEQVAIFRLRTGHNHLKHHLFTKHSGTASAVRLN